MGSVSSVMRYLYLVSLLVLVETGAAKVLLVVTSDNSKTDEDGFLVVTSDKNKDYNERLLLTNSANTRVDKERHFMMKTKPESKERRNNSHRINGKDTQEKQKNSDYMFDCIHLLKHFTIPQKSVTISDLDQDQIKPISGKNIKTNKFT